MPDKVEADQGTCHARTAWQLNLASCVQVTKVIIRPETYDDSVAIRRVTEMAFRGRPYAAGDEQDVVDRPRAHDALTLSLVAIDDGELIGQITFSPAINSDGSSPWIALGPVSVLPARQGEGVGTRLIQEGLEKVAALGALGCILTGNQKYYRRFGFELSPQNAPSNEPQEYFMLKLLGGERPEGVFSFHRLFYGA